LGITTWNFVETTDRAMVSSYIISIDRLLVSHPVRDRPGTLEALPRLGRRRQMRRQDLHRYRAIEPRVICPVNLPIPPAPTGATNS
jgi:hypothetical protein